MTIWLQNEQISAIIWQWQWLKGIPYLDTPVILFVFNINVAEINK